MLVIDQESDEDDQQAEASSHGAKLDKELPAKSLHQNGGEHRSQGWHKDVEDGNDVAEFLGDDRDQGFLPINRNSVDS